MPGGPGWWRSIPRVGAGRAAVIVAWLRRHSATLGAVVVTDFTVTHPAPSLVLDPRQPARLAPLGRFSLPAALDGSNGINRGSQFCFIQAKNDLLAVECYLARFDDQVHTQRAYRREVERFMLWAVLIVGKPLSSLLVDDCEAYKRFLIAPTPAFMGVRAGRFTTRWKPFSTTPLSAASQKQAVLILRAAFAFLVRVRYLAGNPWVVVKDPRVAEPVHRMQIEKALTDSLWRAVVDQLTRRAENPDHHQERAALAAILLLGDSGLRRAEAASATRNALRPSPWAAGVWMLRVLGKRNKLRDVPVSSRTVEAIRAHWVDRGLDFETRDLF